NNLNTSIGGLTSLSADGYYVNVQKDGTVKFYDTKDHAKDGGSTGLVDLTSGATGTEHDLYKYITISGSEVPNPLDNVKFNPTGTVRLLDLGGDTGLRTGDVVKYDAHGGGNVAVAAASDESNQSRALPSDGGGKGSNVGVGASVAVNVPINTVNAEIADGTSWSGTAGTFSVSANSGDFALTHGENGATGSDAIGIGVAGLVAQATVSAY